MVDKKWGEEMKKIIVIIITLVYIFSVTGCGKKYEGPLSCMSYIGNEGTVVLIDMTEDVHKEILEVLNSGHWYNDVSKTLYDFNSIVSSDLIIVPKFVKSLNQTLNGNYYDRYEHFENLFNTLKQEFEGK